MKSNTSSISKFNFQSFWKAAGGLAIMGLMAFGCNKGGQNLSSNGTNPRDTTVIVTPAPTPTPPPPLITKIMGVSSVSVRFTQINGMYELSALAGSNLYGGTVRFDAGGTLRLFIRNAGTYTSYYFGPSPFLAPQYPLMKSPDAVLPSDTLGTCVIIEGFDKATLGYDRAIVVVCKDAVQNSGSFGIGTEQAPDLVRPALDGVKQVKAIYLNFN